jgi:hypothetical protein
MEPAVRSLLSRVAHDPAFADRYFADPAAQLAGLDLDPATREALLHLDREAVRWMDRVDDDEPPSAAEHPQSANTARWLTPLLGLWLCAAYVFFWLVAGGSR